MFGYGLGDLIASMAHLAIPKAADAIDVFVALVVPQQRAFAPHDAHKIGFGGLGKGVQEGIGHGYNASWKGERARVARAYFA